MTHTAQVLLLLVALVAVLAKDVQKRQAPYYQKPSPQAYYKRPPAPPQQSYYQAPAQAAYRRPAYQPAPQPAYYQPAYYQPAAPAAPAYYQPQPAAPAYYQPQAGPAYGPKPKKPKGQDLSKVPGAAGVDYPIFHSVPDTKFTCASVPAHPGIYANVETGCQAYHVCHDGREGHQGASFLCPNGTIFNQHEFACDWWYNVNCNEAPQLYSLNLDPIKNPYAPKPKKEEEPAPGPEYYHP